MPQAQGAVNKWGEVMGQVRFAIPPPDVQIQQLENEYEAWLRELWPKYFGMKSQPVDFGPMHHEFWQWAWTIEPDLKVDPFIGIWSRFFGKSTNVEALVAALGCRNCRRYAIYVSNTQPQADAHVQNIADMLEGPQVRFHYPQMAQRLLNLQGHSKGWRQNILRTATGYTVEAIGLDKLVRGLKREENRPDLIVFDDLDDTNDGPKIIKKKIDALTKKILPMGTNDLTVVGVQNLVNERGIFSRLADGTAGFLNTAHIAGPYPFVEGLQYDLYTDEQGRQKATFKKGTPTWDAYTLLDAEARCNDIGPDAFLTECQHEKTPVSGTRFGALWKRSIHVLPPFAIPDTWTLDRSFDWGSSKPFGVLWEIESDGFTPLYIRGQEVHFPRGTLIIVREWYGWNGRPNEGLALDSKDIADGITERERKWELGQVKAGPSDPIIYDERDGNSIAHRMEEHGVVWHKFAGGPGSRVRGAQLVQEGLNNAIRGEGPGLYISEYCEQLIRTLPGLRRDPIQPDDVDTDGEDHLYDCLKNRLLYRKKGPSSMGAKTLRG